MTETEPLWPLLLYGFLVVVVALAMLVVSRLLGPQHAARGRDLPYESGINPTGSARLRYGVHFYAVGIFFILFDVEVVFLYAWAVAFRELSWPGYVEAVLFIVTLFLGLVYVWKCGRPGLEPEPENGAERGER